MIQNHDAGTPAKLIFSELHRGAHIMSQNLKSKYFDEGRLIALGKFNLPYPSLISTE